MTTADNQPLGQALAENQAFLQTMFGGSSDFYTKSFTICGCRCCIAMFAGLSSPEKLCRLALDMLDRDPPFSAVGRGCATICLNKALSPPSRSQPQI